MRVAVILITTLFTSLSANAERDNFGPIDGKNYYQVLGVAENVSQADLKSAHRRLIMQHHPDVGGSQSLAMSQAINSAYDVLKDPKKRSRYNSWLHSGSASYSGTHSDDRGRHEYDESEFRKKQVDATAEFVVKHATEMRSQHPNITFYDLVNRGRLYVVYFVRFMPMASYAGSDLYDLIFFHGVKAFEYGKIDEDALAMLAGGALTYLTEEASYGMSDDYTNYFERARDMIRMRLEWHRDDISKRRIWDELWKITSGGQSFYPPPPRPRPANSCEAALTGTFIKDGVKYEVPIKISIKIGH